MKQKIELRGNQYIVTMENKAYTPRALEYMYRPWMLKARFTVKNVIYEITKGAWIVQDKEVYDAIEFKDVKTGKLFLMPEHEFFNKINIYQAKIK